MPQISLRENLSKIGEPKPGTTTIHIPSGFHTAPKSLKAMIHSMNSPKMESWAAKCEDHQADSRWTFECQGITTDGKYWYAVNNNNHKPGAMGIFRFNIDYGDLKYRRWPSNPNNHVGPPSYFDKKIYVPVETGDAPLVWILDTELTTLDLAALRGTELSGQHKKMPWCAINPWNGLLYSSRFGGGEDDPVPVSEVHCYDPAKSFDFKKSLKLQSLPISEVQGGCFSSNGHLYLTSGDEHIHGYSVLNGSYLGSFHVPSDWTGAEEMEGIAIGNIPCKDTDVHVPVHVLVLDNDHPRTDSDIWLKHIA
ncbi:MAG: hypothetical protein ACREAS_02650, partial [Nitrososphaera sp.]